MKILKAVMIAVVLLLVPAYAFSSNLGYMRISLAEGDVQIKTPDTEDWGYASINTPLAEGDQVWVPQGSRAELQLNSGTYIRLDEDTALQILSIDKDSSQFYLSQGYAYISYDAPRGSVIQVDTPDASTRAFNRAIFRIDMSDRYTDVSVYKGYVETENQLGNTRINAGSMVSLGQNTNGEVAPMGPPDEWERWNKRRNERIYASEGNSSRYLPAELRAYSYDFDNSGRWIQDPEYGYVWTPTIVIGASWSPYRNGRWIWRGDDYVWVGYEPWGWAPYHYGRWSFGVNIGWFWVPPIASEVYWSPGYVGWVRTNDYVAWVPLAPGEIYYGRGNYGRHSVNITNVNINQVNITNVYKNVYINNGVTVVNRNTFNTGSPTMVNVSKNIIQEKIFVKNNISVGRPDIKPTMASYFASDKAIPQLKLPPQPVRNIQVKELKQSRRFIKEPEKSVMNLGVKPKTLPMITVTTPRTPGKGKPSIQQVQPEEKRKTLAPEGGNAPRGERQQVTPAERVKPGAPVSSPAGRGERKQVQPEEKRKTLAPEGGNAPRGERQQVTPAERVKPG
ncbi:MAG: FecR domain-containing protein, partial [Nitrospirae bacterium]|nr:FecR domain-containing protein [Nitrospirota bacterium]